MKIVVGLGNPGKKYVDTPHNVGFRVIEELSRDLSCRQRRSFRFKARVGSAAVDGEKVLLVKPETYMNNSGLAVGPILRYRKLEPADLIVVLDDADLDFGRIRVRPRGSSGGHKGLGSVIDSLHSSDFVRIRIGIGRREAAGELIDQVLRRLSGDELAKISASVGMAAEAVMCVVRSGVDAAMNKYNGMQIE